MPRSSPSPSLRRNRAPAASAADARTLAKYDKNKNGKLDADEVATMQADEAKAAKAVVNTPSSGAAKEEVIELSPFEVNSGSDKGYAASSSLSGTRLNSRLEDIASSISVVTKQQLLDTAALDINDIFQYEVGTEGTAQFTDPTNDGRGNYDNVSGNPTGANRVRGLAQAGILIGGFAASSSIPIDPYNIDSVEISRGPNSTTAGLSDAGGTVNLNVSKANVTRETTNFSSRVDSFDGYRFSLDLNRPLIKNKLAVRVSAVYNETGYVRKPSVDRTNRQQIGFTYRPFKTTNFSGSFERFHEWAQRPNSITPRDTITNWRNAGSPTYDWGGGPFTAGAATGGRFTINGVVQAPITTMTNNVPNGIALLGSSNARDVQYIDGGQVYAFMRGGQPNNTPAAIDQFTQSAGVSAAGPLYVLPGTTDRSIYDWTKINVAAPNRQIQYANLFNLSLDQEAFKTEHSRLDVNAGWRRERQLDYRRQFIAQQDGVPAVLEMDTNARLVDGRPNPFFLHPFIGGLAPQIFVYPTQTDSYRSQLGYQLDYSRESGWKKWLGLHRWTAYGETSTKISAPSGLRYHDSVTENPNFVAGLLTLSPTSNFTANNAGLFYPLYYMGKTPGGGVEYANSGPIETRGKNSVGSYFNATTNQWVTGETNNVEEIYFSGGKQKRIVRTLGASFQDFWLDGRLVTTYGQRQDRSYVQDNLTPLTLNNGFYDTSGLDKFGQNKKYLSGVTRSKGAVVKPFIHIPGIDRVANEGTGFASYVAEAVRGFNLNLSRSNTFLPADVAYNLYLSQLPNPTSQAKEFGFTVNMFGRFSLRLTHQETTQFHTRAGTGTIATRVLGIDFHPGGQNLTFNLYDAATGWMTNLHPEYTPQQAQDAAAKLMGYTPDFIANAGGKTIGDASDATSKGWELEVNFNPSRYWTMKVTGNQQEAIDSSISLFIQKYINERLPLWTTIRSPLDNSVWWTTTQGSNGRPVDYYTQNVQTPMNLAIATQGKKKPQTREYAFTYVSSYQLAGLQPLADSHPWLKSVTLGGSYRWSSQGAIGYLGGVPDSDGVLRALDPNKPVYDHARDSLSVFGRYRTKLFRGRIGTTFQLNVNNVTESGGKLQPTAVNPDGSPWRFRIIDPRQFIFTTTFDL